VQDNTYVYGRVCGVGKFTYANKNFKGAKGVAIATIFRPKIFKNARITVLYAT